MSMNVNNSKESVERSRASVVPQRHLVKRADPNLSPSLHNNDNLDSLVTSPASNWMNRKQNKISPKPWNPTEKNVEQTDSKESRKKKRCCCGIWCILTLTIVGAILSGGIIGIVLFFELRATTSTSTTTTTSTSTSTTATTSTSTSTTTTTSASTSTTTTTSTSTSTTTTTSTSTSTTTATSTSTSTTTTTSTSTSTTTTTSTSTSTTTTTSTSTSTTTATSTSTSTTTTTTTAATTVTITSNTCTSNWNSVSLYSFCTNCPDIDPYQQYAYTYVAIANQTRIAFAIREDVGFFALDDISITSISAPTVELLTNGGFEIGTFSPWIYCNPAGATYAGTLEQTSSNFFYQGYTFAAHGGNYYYLDGAVGQADYLIQMITTTIGQTYNISFWLYNHGSGTNSNVNVIISI